VKKFIFKNLWWVTFIIALILLVLHSFSVTVISVDTTSIFLLLILLISPFVSSIKKLKFGDFEAEIDPKEVKRLRDSAETGLSQTKPETENLPEIRKTVIDIEEIGVEDQILALAKLRIEIEKVLRKIIRSLDFHNKNRPMSLGSIVQRLGSQEIIPQEITNPLREVIGICNRAVHGESISKDSAISVIGVGTDLLETLYWISKEFVSGRIIEESIINHDELDENQNTIYRLTTVVPLVENPKKVVREVNQEQLDEFLDGYNEFAEFIIEIVPVDD